MSSEYNEVLDLTATNLFPSNDIDDFVKDLQKNYPSIEIVNQEPVQDNSPITDPEKPFVQSPASTQKPKLERPFHCDQCGLGFTQKGNLSRHKQIHTPNKPFKCDLCPYASRRKDALINHRSTHCIEKPFKCSKCIQAYKQKSSLRDHLKTVHKLTMEEIKSLLPDTSPPQPPYIMQPSNPPNQASINNRHTVSQPVQRPMYDDMYDGMSQVVRSVYGMSTNGVSSENSSPASDVNDEEPEDLSDCKKARIDTSTSAEVIPQESIKMAAPKYPADYNMLRQKQTMQMLQYYNDYYSRLADTRFRMEHIERIRQQQAAVLQAQLNQQAKAQPSPESSPKPISPNCSTCDTCKRTTWKCEHCGIIFLDSVIYTIHSGLHSNKNPFQCNNCGFVAENKYEFSSHIARGEHRSVSEKVDSPVNMTESTVKTENSEETVEIS
nr:ikaros/helios zinc finger [Hofstenia miamia]